jgi:hypothetical protein
MLDAVVAKNVLLASLAAGIGVAAGWGICSRLASAGAAAAVQELQARRQQQSLPSIHLSCCCAD